jgi:putative hydrolase of the HAD superfamily
LIKAVLFDYDGVLTLDKSGSYSICKYISSQTHIDYDKLSIAYQKYNNDLLVGKITHEDIWEDFCASIGKSISIRYLFDAYKNTSLNQKMYDLVKKINKTYKTALITDNKKDRIDFVRQWQKLDDIFCSITISAEIGSGKEFEAIFLRTVKELSVECSECVFIDNQEKNLIVPNKLGIKTIFYDHKENNIKELISKLKELKIMF